MNYVMLNKLSNNNGTNVLTKKISPFKYMFIVYLLQFSFLNVPALYYMHDVHIVSKQDLSTQS